MENFASNLWKFRNEVKPTIGAVTDFLLGAYGRTRFREQDFCIFQIDNIRNNNK